MSVLNVFSFAGTVSSARYWVLGILLFALKYPIDHCVAEFGFGRQWSPLTYFSVRNGPLLHPLREPYLWLALMAVALPFLWCGLALTVQRLRDAGRSPAWAGLFFLPYGNYLFFLIVASLRSRLASSSSATAEEPDARHEGREGLSPYPDGPFARLIPRHPAGAFLVCLVCTSAIALIAVFLAHAYGERWGSTLFLVVPFSMGFFTTAILGYHDPIPFSACVGMTLCIMLGTEAVLFIGGYEGVPCLLMATPILFPLAVIGAAIAFQLVKRRWQASSLMLFALGLIPTAFQVERDFPPAIVPTVVESVVDIDATPDIVWKRVVKFPKIRDEKEWIFQLGVAAPESAEIDGSGEGALRRCVFDRGVFEEPIEVWREAEELTFGVRSQPRHLDSYLGVRRGQFVLVPLADGRTRLYGRTWLDLKVHPSFYWRLWSDSIIETIHQRVLRHVERLAEEDAAAFAAAQAE